MRGREKIHRGRVASAWKTGTAFALLLSGFAVGTAGAVEYKPQVWGYGVKRCEDFLGAVADKERGSQEASVEYIRYQEWLAGLVTGLSLATAQDVLKGTELDKAMESIGKNCRSSPEDDFFKASMDLIRALSLF